MIQEAASTCPEFNLKFEGSVGYGRAFYLILKVLAIRDDAVQSYITNIIIKQ